MKKYLLLILIMSASVYTFSADHNYEVDFEMVDTQRLDVDDVVYLDAVFLKSHLDAIQMQFERPAKIYTIATPKVGPVIPMSNSPPIEQIDYHYAPGAT